MTLITTSQDLQALCDRLSDAEYITVDTEFMREKTYWPQLCLVQVAGRDDAAAIDPMAPGMDLAPLFTLLADTKILKVFHAARQDLEIFLKLTGRLPTPVFDTQVAAMVCGFGDSVGYETLVSQLVKGRIDKSSRFTDWSRRPLSARQITYALADVTHLRGVYEKLRDLLAKNQRLAWLDEEMAVLTAEESYIVEPREAFRRIKARRTKPRQLAILRELAAWRERAAQDRDLPRNRVLRDEALLEIAHHPPATAADLERIRGIGAKFAQGPMGKQILQAVADGLAVPDADCPQPIERPPLPRGIGPVADLLKVLLKLKSEESGVAQKLIASAFDVDQLAAFGAKSGVPALNGWRHELYGKDALALISGKTALTLEGRNLAVIELEDA